MNTKSILAFSGSARGGSFNQRLVTIAAGGARATGAEVTLINLADFPMPLFDEDLEARDGVPAKARELRDLITNSKGLLIATPEYNSTLTPLLKNAIDWVSREDGESGTLAAFKDKTIALVSASPGGYGGSRSLKQLRELLGNIRVSVIEEEFSLPSAHKAFNPDDSLIDDTHKVKAESVGAALARAIA